MKNKIVSMLLVSIFILTTMSSSCFALEKKSQTNGNYSPPIIAKIGGGDSPSGGWEHYGRETVYMSRSQLQDLLEKLYEAKRSNASKETKYNIIKDLASLAKVGSALPFINYIFPTQFDVINDSYDIVLYKLNRYDDKKFKVHFEIYHRPANGEKMASVLNVIRVK